MVLIMSVLVTPFGVLAAIYLREYARQGTVLKIIRVSVYNLAGGIDAIRSPSVGLTRS